MQKEKLTKKKVASSKTGFIHKIIAKIMILQIDTVIYFVILISLFYYLLVRHLTFEIRYLFGIQAFTCSIIHLFGIQVFTCSVILYSNAE